MNSSKENVLFHVFHVCFSRFLVRGCLNCYDRQAKKIAIPRIFYKILNVAVHFLFKKTKLKYTKKYSRDVYVSTCTYLYKIKEIVITTELNRKDKQTLSSLVIY